MPTYRVRPSGLPLTVACNASLQLQESCTPLPETDEEAEGHAAHWVARRYLAGWGHELPVGRVFDYGGRDWTVDDDMHAGAVLYHNAVGGCHADLHVEETIECKRVHYSECGGTPDAFRYFHDARSAWANCPDGIPLDRFLAGRIKLVRVGDYKYGHRYVEVFENYQLTPYVTGVMDKLGLLDIDEDLYVEMILVQPRTYRREGPVRVWRVQAIELRHAINDCNEAADAALMPLGEPFAPKAKTGKHCLDCRARHVCAALQTQNMSLVDYAHTAERIELPPMALGQELAIVEDAIERLKARHTGLYAQAEAMVRAGQAVPFYGMEPAGAKLTYLDNVDTDELVNMGDLFGIDLRKKLERKDRVVTPTQAIQLGIDEATMKAYAQRPAGKLKLSRINTTAVRKVFNT